MQFQFKVHITYPNMIFLIFNYGDIKAHDAYLHSVDGGDRGTVQICSGYVNLNWNRSI